MTTVLGIETSCDETALAIVIDGKQIICQKVASHIDIQESFGGVFPEMSSRRHFDLLLPLLESLLKEAELKLDQIDLIAVATHPGLIGSLLMGVNVAKALSYALGIPVVGVNHLEAHLYAAMMSEQDYTAPSIGLIASGGHTSLVLIRELGQYEIIGNTLDDAAGEAFDKVGRILDLAYPAGPKIEALAKTGNPKKFDFSTNKDSLGKYEFSYSGLKTKALYFIKGQNKNSKEATILPSSLFPDFAASFQEAILTPLVDKALLAAAELDVKKIYVGGGVSNNRRLRALFQEKNENGLSIVWPLPGLSLDNGAMIAGLGYQVFLRKGKKGENLSFTAFPSIKSLSI